MKTAKEYAITLMLHSTTSMYEKVIEQIQGEAYNQAIDDADKIIANMNASELTVIVRIRIEKLKK